MAFDIEIFNVAAGFGISIGDTPDPDPDPVIPTTAARGPAVADTIAMDAEDGANVVYEWATDVHEALSGKEKRLALRPAPRETYRFPATLSDEQLARIQTAQVVDGAAGSAFAIGLAHEALLVSEQSMTRSWSRRPFVPVPNTAFSDWTYPGMRAVVLSPDAKRQWNCVVQPSETDASYPWTMTKITSGGAWDTITQTAAVARGDCWIEAVAPLQTGFTATMFGLGPNPTAGSFSSIERGIFMDGNGAGYRVCEFGVIVASGAYATGDVFRVERSGTTLRYYKNDVLIHTSASSSNSVTFRGGVMMHYPVASFVDSVLTGVRFAVNGSVLHTSWEDTVGLAIEGTGGEVPTAAYPTSQAAANAMVRWGDWNHGGACDATTGQSLLPDWGTFSWDPNGDVGYGKLGPLGGTDKCVTCGDGSYGNRFESAEPDLQPGINDDLAVAMVVQTTGEMTDELYLFVTANFATIDYKIRLLPGVDSVSMGVDDGADSAGAQVLGIPDEPFVVMSVLERGNVNKIRIAIRTASGVLKVSPEVDASAIGALTHAGGTYLGFGNGQTPCAFSHWMVAHGPGAAKGLSRNLADAIENYASSLWPKRVTVDTLGDGYPRSAEKTREAFGGRGQWGWGWLLNETVADDDLAPAFGSLTLAINAGTNVCGVLGPLGGSDKAIKFETGSGYWQGGVGDFEVGVNDDLAIAAIVRFARVPTAGTYGNLVSKVLGGFVDGWSLTGTGGTGYGIAFGPGGGGSGNSMLTGSFLPDAYCVGEWHLILAVMDRALGKVQTIVRSLATGKEFVGPKNNMLAVAAAAGAASFRVGQSAWVGANQASRIGALYIAFGPGAAAGLLDDISQAARSFHEYIMPPAGSRIMPAMPSYLSSVQGSQLHPNNAARHQLEAHAAFFGDSRGRWTPKPAPPIAEYKPFLETDWYPVWDRRVVVEGTLARSVLHGTQMIDRGGPIKLVGYNTVSKFQRQLIVRLGDDADRQYLKAFFGRCVGKQKLFLLPTWKQDLIPVDGDASTSIIKIKSQTSGGVDYATKWLNSPAHKQLMLVCDDGSIVYRTVSDATDNLDGTQTLQFDFAVTGKLVTAISFLEKCRFDSDAFDVAYQHARGLCRVPVMVVQR